MNISHYAKRAPKRGSLILPESALLLRYELLHGTNVHHKDALIDDYTQCCTYTEQAYNKLLSNARDPLFVLGNLAIGHIEITSLQLLGNGATSAR